MRALLKDIETVPPLTRFGRVARIEGLGVEVSGALGAVRLGGQVHLSVGHNKTISGEVIGFRDVIGPHWVVRFDC
jgi:flagellum-specific ATP synthase